MTLDDTDTRLLSLLAQDARIPVARLADKLGLARTTVQARLEKLERTGTIRGYAIRLGDAASAAMLRATVLMQIAPRGAAGVLSRLKHMPEVEIAHTCAGRFDLCVQVRTQTPAALDKLLDRIGEIEDVHDVESLIHLSTRIDRAI
ncbi:MAG: Lrp/AsnC family transcriptional regulator, partial [Shimia sp.]